jgi:hypothetical protein
MSNPVLRRARFREGSVALLAPRSGGEERDAVLAAARVG